MKAVVLELHTPEWHTWCVGGIEGDDPAIIAADAGLCKSASWMKTLNELWRIKTGRASDVFTGNWANRRGNKVESLARGAYEESTGILLSPMFGEMADINFIRSSFDGVSFDRNVIGVMQIGYSHVHALAQENEVVDYYRPHLAHQALTAWGMPEAWRPEHTVAFISYDTDRGEMLHVTKSALVYRELAEKLLVVEKKFWDRVQQDSEPCGDNWLDAAKTYLTVHAQLEAVKRQEAAAKVRLVELLGDKNAFSAAGVSVEKKISEGCINYQKIVAEQTTLTTDAIEAYREICEPQIHVRILT